MHRAEPRTRPLPSLLLLACCALSAQDYPVEHAPVGSLPVRKAAVTAPTASPETSRDAPAPDPGAGDPRRVGGASITTPVQTGAADPDEEVAPASAAERNGGRDDAAAAAEAAQGQSAATRDTADGAADPETMPSDSGGAPAPFLIDPSGNPPDRAGPVAPFVLLGSEIAVGTRADLRWRVGESFDGSMVTTPVIVLHGTRPGPRLCLTAAVHGDELNGIEVVRRIVNEVDPKTLGGTVIGVPVVNLLGFSRGSRYLPDRRDLNRFFPGTSGGSAAARIAHSLFHEIVRHCDALVDFHTGSFDRANLPQVRGDLTVPAVLAFTRGFGATPVLHSPGARGMLRLAASLRGIPAVTFEVGAPQRIEPEQIEVAVQAISTLMHKMGMTNSFRLWAEPQATYYESKWVRVDEGGMLISTVRLGDRVRERQRLGKVVDPLRNSEHEILAPFAGRVIGMALNQVVLPGFAAYHLGVETSEEGAVQDALAPGPAFDAIERLEGDEMSAPPDDEPRSEPDAPMPPE